jgi:AcrR family transcriptional regulator
MDNHAYPDVQIARRNAQGRNKPRNSQKTLADIMDVAEALFARYGYEGTSLRQVAEGANMTQPNFYNYFSSKEKLYESVLARSVVPLTTLVRDGIANTLSDGSLELNDDIAYAVLDAFVELLAKNRNLAGLIYQESIKGGDKVSRLFMDMFEGMLVQSAFGLERSNKGAWSKQQIPFLMAGWFNLVFGYFASANLMKDVAPGSRDPLSAEALREQQLFLRNAWNKLMRT